MKELKRRLIDLFCYCGLSKEEYRDIKKEAYISNFNIWKYLHLVMFMAYAILAAAMLSLDGPTPITYVQYGMAVYFAVIALLFRFVFSDDSLIAQLIIYLTMILLLGTSLFIAVMQPNAGGVTFIVLMVMLPTVMIDKPYFMALVIAGAMVAYLCALHGVKDPIVFRYDIALTVFYGLIGIFINVFYNTIRVHEFTLKKRERVYIEEQKAAREEADKLNAVLKVMSESTLELLGDVVEDRDPESGEHIRRVKGFAYLLAKQVKEDLPEYGLDDYAVDMIALTSALHDVGKISISDSILLKPGKLTAEEFAIMKTHCEKGCAILEKMRNKWSEDYLSMSLDICRSHHEKWDGRGYPQGLKGDDIPIAAQIVSIADIFDALTTKRVYKDAYPYDKAFAMILGGECGAFSQKLMGCFVKCYDKFKAHADGIAEFSPTERSFELVSKSNPGESFVIGLHDSDRVLQEKLRLGEEISIMNSLSENFCYICYVNIPTNEVIRYKADRQFTQILDSFGGDIQSNERFDKLLNSIIVSEDYDSFRAATARDQAMVTLQKAGHITTDFRIRLDDGIHYCRMRISPAENDPSSVIIGISKRDEEHKLEADYLTMQNELENARREMENREKLADRLAVIDCISNEYDYVCSLNADTMDVTVYRAEAWIRDMFKNLEDIVVSPEARNLTLKGIIHPDDFEPFKEASMHSSVLRGLAAGSTYTVNYRAYKYGRLVNYQTRYTVDHNDPKRIVIGLRSLGDAEE